MEITLSELLSEISESINGLSRFITNSQTYGRKQPRYLTVQSENFANGYATGLKHLVFFLLKKYEAAEPADQAEILKTIRAIASQCGHQEHILVALDPFVTKGLILTKESELPTTSRIH